MIVINIGLLTEFIFTLTIFNCPLLKDISFNRICWFYVINHKSHAWLSQYFGTNHPREFSKVLTWPIFTRAIPKFSRMKLGNLSQIAKFSTFFIYFWSFKKLLAAISEKVPSRMLGLLVRLWNQCNQFVLQTHY